VCGIVGLFAKDPELEPELGRLLASMLGVMSDRGPDSAGFALYGAGERGRIKLTLRGRDLDGVASALGEGVLGTIRDTHLVLSIAGSDGAVDSKAAISTAGSPAGRVSLRGEFLPTLTVAAAAGLSAARIHQDLVTDHGFTGSYESVKRCVRALLDSNQ